MNKDERMGMIWRLAREQVLKECGYVNERVLVGVMEKLEGLLEEDENGSVTFGEFL